MYSFGFIASKSNNPYHCLQMTIEKEVIDGTLPFIREKPRDIALVSAVMSHGR